MSLTSVSMENVILGWILLRSLKKAVSVSELCGHMEEGLCLDVFMAFDLKTSKEMLANTEEGEIPSERLSSACRNYPEIISTDDGTE